MKLTMESVKLNEFVFYENIGENISEILSCMHLKNMLKNRYEKIILNAQSYAVPFYEKLGYVITSPEFMDADIPHRAMEKKMIEKVRAK